MLERCDVRGGVFGAPVQSMSGGNQQKVLLARTLLCEPQVLIADEPTRGVDVGAKRAIYDFLAEFAADGRGVILISSELEEVLGLAHRILVMRRGPDRRRARGRRDDRERDPARRVRGRLGGGVSTHASGASGWWPERLGWDRLRGLGILIPFALLFGLLS